MNSLPKTVTRQRRDCDLNPGPSALESSTLNTRLPSHPNNDKNSGNQEQEKEEAWRRPFDIPQSLSHSPVGVTRSHKEANLSPTCSDALSSVRVEKRGAGWERA